MTFLIIDNLGAPIHLVDDYVFINNLGSSMDVRGGVGCFGAPLLVIDKDTDRVSSIVEYISHIENTKLVEKRNSNLEEIGI